MAITKMKKFTLICFSGDKKRVTKSLQRFGNSEFINLQTEPKDESNPLNMLSKDKVSEDIQSIEARLLGIKSAIKTLEKFVPKQGAMESLKSGKSEIVYETLKEVVLKYDFNGICEHIKKEECRLNNIESEMTTLTESIEALEPWISLQLPFSELVGGKSTKINMGYVSVKLVDEVIQSLSGLEFVDVSEVSRDSKNVYLLILGHKDAQDDVDSVLKKYDFIDAKFDLSCTASEAIYGYQSRIKTISEERKSIRLKLSQHIEDLHNLRLCEEYYENEKERLLVSNNFLGSKTTIVMSGWVPSEDVNMVEAIIKDATNGSYVMNFEEVAEHEDLEVPVKLKNNKFFSAFEGITEMYSLPNYKGLDPTPLLAPFYMLFFGMMVGDFGYGLLITIACMAAMKMFNLDEASNNFAKLFMWLGVSTTGWGLVYGAGFGDKIKFDSLLDMNTDIMTIMGLSIGFGVFQILVALGVKAYMCIKNKQYFAAFADVGLWLVSFVGIAMFAIGVPFGKLVMISGMVGIVLTNGRDASGTAGKLASGAYALYGITNYVGDLVSYTRLMALGVAGGSIASAMNLIIGYLPQNLIVVLILAPLLFVAVHIFNLLLGALGAYVHSCRLQYVEYFGKFYDGGGRAFKPFKMKNNNIKVK